jgi:hypothetical protein
LPAHDHSSPPPPPMRMDSTSPAKPRRRDRQGRVQGSAVDGIFHARPRGLRSVCLCVMGSHSEEQAVVAFNYPDKAVCLRVTDTQLTQHGLRLRSARARVSICACTHEVVAVRVCARVHTARRSGAAEGPKRARVRACERNMRWSGKPSFSRPIAHAHCAHLRGSSRFRAAALAVRSGAALPSARTGERVGALTVIG